MHEDEIQGVRVVLVPLRGDDADELAGLLDDPTIRAFFGERYSDEELETLADLLARLTDGGTADGDECKPQ